MIADVGEIEAGEAEIIRRSPAAWLEGYGRIKVKDRTQGEGGLVWLRDVRLGWLQRRVCDIVKWCLANKKRIRLLLYKKRQTGASTISVGLLKWFCARYNMDALIVGGAREQADNLWEILKTYHAWDTAPWGVEAEVGERLARFSHGSLVRKTSLLSHDPGRSRTVTFLLATEVARWAEEGVKNASDVLSGLSSSMPDVPLSVEIWESTVRGGSGAFFKKWQGAAEFEAFQAGEEGNGFIRVFEPWFLGFDARLPVTERERNDILAGIGAPDAEEAAIEHELRHTYRLTPEHIKFWRNAYHKCLGDPDERDRDYPTTPEHGFRASVPGRFNLKALKFMRVETERAVQKDQRFILLTQPDARQKRFTCEVVDSAKEAVFLRLEEPLDGLRYVMAVDPMTGVEDDERAGREKRDTHGVAVLRLGHFDAVNGLWKPDRVVSCSMPDCRWPVTELAKQVERLAHYYGDCLVVPEANFDSGLILKLREADVHVYERERPPTDKEPGQKTGKFGFLTRGQDGEASRRSIIETLADAIRHWNKEGHGIDLGALHVVDQCQHFIIKDGKEQALAGKHDDMVLAVAMALACRSGATRYIIPRTSAPLPPELVRHERRRKSAAPGRTHRR